ncbi:MAG: SapC family protein [Pseudohongiellaceae bacterium]
MSKIVPLQNDKHKNLKLAENSDYTRHKERHLIPIIAQDFFSLAAEFPIVFVKNGDTGEVVPVVVMSLREGQNLYCNTEGWQAPVIPMSFTNPPFSVARADPEGEQYVVMLDEESELLSETEGEALFKEDGEKTEYLEKRIESVSFVAEQVAQTQAICKLLEEKELLTTQQIQLQYRPDGTPYNIDGIYVVDEAKLNELSDEDFLDMRKRGLVGMMYAHLTSLQQLRRISKLQYEADKEAGLY